MGGYPDPLRSSPSWPGGVSRGLGVTLSATISETMRRSIALPDMTQT